MNSKLVRCDYNNKYNNKKCKHKFILTHDNKILHTHNYQFLCTFHMKYVEKLQFLEKNIIIIQKYYIGYRVRKKINNIFKKLPDDIQNLIIHKHIRKNYYNDKYNKSVQKILNNKINKYYDNYKNMLNMEEKDFIFNILKNEKYLLDLAYLSGKYKYIINIRLFIIDFKRHLSYILRGYWQLSIENRFTNEELSEIYNLYLNNKLINKFNISDLEMYYSDLIYRELLSFYYIIDNYLNPENNMCHIQDTLII